MNTLTALWHAAGCPEPNWQGKATKPVDIPVPRPGVCALTGAPGMVWPLAKITTTLTTIDRFRFRDADPAGLALGPAATWALRHRAAMQHPHGTLNSVFTQLDPPSLLAALTALADDPHGWIGVPQSRQKHLLPWAEPGTVRTDDETLRWGHRQVELPSSPVDPWFVAGPRWLGVGADLGLVASGCACVASRQ